MKKLLIIIIVTLLIIPSFGTPCVSANELVQDFLQAYNLPVDTSRDEYFEFIMNNATKKPWEEEFGENLSEDEIKSYLFARRILPEELGIKVDSEFEDWSVSFYTPWPENQPLPSLTGIVSKRIEKYIMTPEFVVLLYSTSIALRVIDTTLYAAGAGQIITGIGLPSGIGTLIAGLILSISAGVLKIVADHISNQLFEQKNLEKEKASEKEPATTTAPQPDRQEPEPISEIESTEDTAKRLEAIVESQLESLEPFGGGSSGGDSWTFDSGGGSSGGGGGSSGGGGGMVFEKPVLYLYPEKESVITVKINTTGDIIESIPDYQDGWTVTVDPSGLINGKYDYLFYEVLTDYDFSKEVGWLIRRLDFSNEMEKILTKVGLEGKEVDDFIKYWDGSLSNSYDYFAVYYLSPLEVEEVMQLSISIKPDSLLRVHFLFVALENPITIESPSIQPFDRKGFTVVEWGGMRE